MPYLERFPTDSLGRELRESRIYIYSNLSPRIPLFFTPFRVQSLSLICFTFNSYRDTSSPLLPPVMVFVALAVLYLR